MATPHYRLRGDVGGIPRRFPIAPGEIRIGSIGENNIVLPVRGVSRRHARLSCGPEGLSIEDLDSKNGVHVNGARIHHAVLAPGAELRLGPVTLTVEEVAEDDSRIAIVVNPDATPGLEGLPAWQTTAVTGVVGVSWLGLIDGVLERLCVLPEADLPGALQLLVNQLQSRGAALIEWGPEGEGLVLAARGEMPDLTRHERFEEVVSDAGSAARTQVVSAVSLEGDPFLTCGLLGGRGLGTLGLVLWGDFPERASSEALMRTLIRLFARFSPQPVRVVHDAPAVPTPGLELPDGYVQGPSPAMAALFAEMRSLARGDLPILILGETGVGKELIATILHRSSDRRGGPFIAVNCAAIPSELLEAEMFGIGKGVATGVAGRPGKFRQASGGTLFLDEIGDMPLDLQAKLLRALQEREIQPVGGAPEPVDIRVLAATNGDLQRRIEEGRFRADLYYRVAGGAIRVPPLRERSADIPSLVDAFIGAFARQAGKAIRGVTVRALRALTVYPWPGNVRELEHEMRRLAYLCPDGEAIDSTMLSPHLLTAPKDQESLAEDDATSLNLEARLQRVEDRLIRQALTRAGGVHARAAKLLGISRNGLALKMRRLGIHD